MTDDNRDPDGGTTSEDVENGESEMEVSRHVTRDDGAAALRRLADGVANGSVVLGRDDAITATVPEWFDLSIEFEQAEGEAELEAELEWSIADGQPVADERGSDRSEHDASETTRTTATDPDVDDGDGAVGDSGDAAGGTDAEESVAEVVGVGDATSSARFELYRDRADEWRWRLVHDNGNIIADSGEGYDRKGTARNGLESVMRNAPGATVVDVED